MSAVAEILEDELIDAIEKKDRKAVKHFVSIITDITNNFENKKEAEKISNEIMLKLSKIEITVKEGFKSVDKRFEDMQRYMDKRFEDVNKRFEGVNKRFESVDKRFESIDKRFESIDKRFKDVNKKFSMMVSFYAVEGVIFSV